MTENCVLCGKPLSQEKTNREHYVPATAIRNFDKLRIPSRFDHALRIDLREDGTGQYMIVPLSRHKEWATVRVHQKCNSDASHMCQDMKYIIDHPHKYPSGKEKSIIEYYTHIWSQGRDEYKDVLFENLSDEVVDRAYQGRDWAQIYSPGILWIGKILVADASQLSLNNDYEQHTTFLGTKKALEKLVKKRVG